MPIYFYVHDSRWFHDDFVPALTLCRRRRSFLPCLSLCRSLIPNAQSFVERYHIGGDVPLLCRLDASTGYDRDLWRLLVGELLIFGALEMPEIWQAPEMLCHLTGPRPVHLDSLMRADFGPMQQAHLGARDLCFGMAFYRPAVVGVNDAQDVDRLAAYLGTLEPACWTEDMLAVSETEVDADE